MKERIYKIIEKAEDEDVVSKIFDYAIIILIIASIASVILESFSGFRTKYDYELYLFELMTVAIFTVEYFLRIWTADLKYPQKKALAARLIYLFSFMAIIDLFAILPFYLPFIISIDLRFLRVVRLTRIFRLFKVNRYSDSLQLIGKVMKEAKEELLTTIFLMFFVILISATLMYNAENSVQPDVFPNIIASLWWAIATLTTVGYGDVYPVTAIGKMLASVIAISGVGLVALPTGIISSEFMREISKQKVCKCPHCGGDIG